MNKSKCPKCDAVITTVNAEDVTIHTGGNPRWKGLSYACPTCGVVLSVEVHPLALKSDIVKQTARRLKQ